MNKTIMAIWGMVVVLICASLIFISNSKKDKILLKLERDIKTCTKEYIKVNNIKVKYNKPFVISINSLIDNNCIIDIDNINKYCVKTILVTKEIISKACFTILMAKHFFPLFLP